MSTFEEVNALSPTSFRTGPVPSTPPPTHTSRALASGGTRLLASRNTLSRRSTTSIWIRRAPTGAARAQRLLVPEPLRTLLPSISILLILRLPSLFEGLWFDDEGVYAAVAKGLHDGKLLYAQTWDSKPPVIFLLYSVAGFLPWTKALVLLHVLVTLVGLGTLLMVYRVARQLAIASRRSSSRQVFSHASSAVVFLTARARKSSFGSCRSR